MNCHKCGAEFEHGAQECPGCGHSFSLTRKIREVFVPGTYIQRTRWLHFILIGALGPLGLLSLTDASLFTNAVTAVVVLSGLYFWALLAGRVIGLRAATPTNRMRACFDTLEITMMALLVSFIEGFWWGFSSTTLNSYSGIPQLHLDASLYAGGIASISLVTGAFIALVTLVEISHSGVGEFRDSDAMDSKGS